MKNKEIKSDRGNFYIKWQDDSYSECAFNADGNLYIFYRHLVQRGMGHQLVEELLIIGMNKSRISDFLKKKECNYRLARQRSRRKNISKQGLKFRESNFPS